MLSKYVRKPFILSVFFLITVLIWYAVFAEERSNVLTVAFLDVGQGDAIFIEAPNGKQVLIDGGSNKDVLRSLSKVMPFYDRSIDVVIATHPDKDHIGGLPDVLARYTVDLFLEPGIENDTGAYRALENIVSKRGVQKIYARRGMQLVLDDETLLRILFPDRSVVGMESNTASIVAQLVYGDTEFLLTGDSPKSIEKYLISLDGKDLKSDVLKVGHHGSKTSSNASFIGMASPDFAIISAGEDNRYGHPHKEVLETLEQFEVKIINTASAGTIVFTSDGKSLQVR